MHQICSLNWLNFSTILGGGGWGTELWIKNTQLNLIKQVLNLGAGDQWSDVLSPEALTYIVQSYTNKFVDTDNVRSRQDV